MASYDEMRKATAGGKYARGGRVSKDKRGRTVINIVLPQPASAPSTVPVGPSAAPAPIPPAAPSTGAPVPPQAAAMALNHMQGKPGAFARGGFVGGAEGGLGRLEKAEHAKRARKHGVAKVKVKGGERVQQG